MSGSVMILKCIRRNEKVNEKVSRTFGEVAEGFRGRNVRRRFRF
jgi:hypothetical protein